MADVGTSADLSTRGFGRASQLPKTKTHPKTGKEYPCVCNDGDYLKVPTGKTYYHEATKKFWKKTPKKGDEPKGVE